MLSLNPTMSRISQRGDETHISALLPSLTIRVVINKDGLVSAFADEYGAGITTRTATHDEVMLAMAYGDAALQMLRSYQPYRRDDGIMPRITRSTPARTPAHVRQYSSAY